MDATRPPMPPAEAIRRWRDGLRELEALTRAERLQMSYAERLHAIGQLYAFWKSLGLLPDPDTRPMCERWIEAKRRWIERHMPSKVNF